MSEEQNVEAESRIKRGSEKAQHASTAAAERARETSKVAQQWRGRARQRIAKPTYAECSHYRTLRKSAIAFLISWDVGLKFSPP